MVMLSDYIFFDLRNKFPNLNIMNFPVIGNPQNFIVVMPVQGDDTRYYTDNTVNVSIIVQNTNSRMAIEHATIIYDHYRDVVNYSMELPIDYEITHDRRKLVINYIESRGRPIPLGDVGNGRYQYSINFIFNIGE